MLLGTLDVIEQIFAIQIQDSRQDVRRYGNVGHLRGIHANRFGGQRLRQRLASAIKNRATRRFNRDRLLLLRLRQAQQLVMLGHLQEGKPGYDGCHP
jgi:hypothetical protein